MASLFGLETARPSRCRLLELGCGDGRNLIPMALALPGGEFSGVDLSENAIAQARDLARRAGAANVTFRCADLLELAPDYGEYDFIVAHGIYSWVPDNVRDRLMEISSRSLARNGVAYISFNTLPGWRYREMFREMLLHHTGKFGQPEERLAQARWFLEFLRDNVAGEDEVRQFVALQCEELLKLQPGHLWHDELEGVNHPVTFRDFIEHGRRHGLDFLAPAGFGSLNADIRPEASAAIDRLSAGDIIEREQYQDYLKLRMYREVLLCHGSNAGRGFRPEGVAGMFAASAAVPVAGEPAQFRTPRGVTVSTNSPAVQETLIRLHDAWPEAIPVADLAAACQAAPEHIGPALLRLAATGVVQLYAEPPKLAAVPGPRPVAGRLARVELETSTVVTNLIHGCIELDDENARRLLALCDGTRDQAALAAELGAPESAAAGMLERLARLALLEQ